MQYTSNPFLLPCIYTGTFFLLPAVCTPFMLCSFIPLMFLLFFFLLCQISLSFMFLNSSFYLFSAPLSSFHLFSFILVPSSFPSRFFPSFHLFLTIFLQTSQPLPVLSFFPLPPLCRVPVLSSNHPAFPISFPFPSISLSHDILFPSSFLLPFVPSSIHPLPGVSSPFLPFVPVQSHSLSRPLPSPPRQIPSSVRECFWSLPEGRPSPSCPLLPPFHSSEGYCSKRRRRRRKGGGGKGQGGKGGKPERREWDVWRKKRKKRRSCKIVKEIE